MELSEVVNINFAVPVVGVVLCAVLVFAFGFKSPVQPPSFDFGENEKKSTKKAKSKKKPGSSNGHIVNLETSEAPKTAKSPGNKTLEHKNEQTPTKAKGKKQVTAKQTSNTKAVKSETEVVSGDWTTALSRKDKKEKLKKKDDPKKDADSGKEKDEAKKNAGSTKEDEPKKKDDQKKNNQKKDGGSGKKEQPKKAEPEEPVVASPAETATPLQQRAKRERQRKQKDKGKNEKAAGSEGQESEGKDVASGSVKQLQKSGQKSGKSEPPVVDIKAGEKQAAAQKQVVAQEDAKPSPKKSKKKKSKSADQAEPSSTGTPENKPSQVASSKSDKATPKQQKDVAPSGQGSQHSAKENVSHVEADTKPSRSPRKRKKGGNKQSQDTVLIEVQASPQTAATKASSSPPQTNQVKSKVAPAPSNIDTGRTANDTPNIVEIDAKPSRSLRKGKKGAKEQPQDSNLIEVVAGSADNVAKVLPSQPSQTNQVKSKGAAKEVAQKSPVPTKKPAKDQSAAPQTAASSDKQKHATQVADSSERQKSKTSTTVKSAANDSTAPQGATSQNAVMDEIGEWKDAKPVKKRKKARREN